MAISIVKRPIGHVLDVTEIDACIWDDYANALVVSPSHGLSTGDYVYIKSNVSNYNGFWYVVFNNGSSFYIREYADADNVASVIDTCDVTYRVSVLDHGFQCVHLPIVYKIESTLWPTNTVDTARTISSITDDNGLCNLNLSGSLGTFNELEYIKISSNTDFSDEVYQVVDKVSSSDITINRAYEAGLSTSGTVILYYNNYYISVEIFAGLSATHRWTSLKPIESITTINVTPDADNIASINVAEIVKSKISPTENSTLNAALPNNIDFTSDFYIIVREYADQAVNGELVETLISIQSDSDNVYTAVNAQLPFKNIHSGHLSAYIYADENNLIKFLTLFNPVLFEGEYFDISYINNYANITNGLAGRLKREVYINDVLQEVFYDTLESITDGNKNTGLYRRQIEQSGWSEDRIDLTVEATASLFNPQYTNQGGSLNWTQTNFAITVSRTGNTTSAETITTAIFRTPFSIPSGESRTFILDFSSFLDLQVTGGTNVTISATVRLKYLDSSFVVTDTNTFFTDSVVGTGDSLYSNLEYVTLAASADVSYIGFEAVFDYTYSTIPSSVVRDFQVTLQSVVCTEYIPVSETKTITVNSDCSDHDIYLGWLNYLGGFEYWKFTARKDYVYDVNKSQITEKNIYTNWPNSYGEFANSITKQIARESRKSIVVRSQYLTLEQLQGIKFIRFSPLVQIVEDKYNVTNVVVDAGSFREYTDQDDLYLIEFTIRFTDTIPAQFE